MTEGGLPASSNVNKPSTLSRARLRQLRELKTARGRREQRAYLIDGEKLVRDALAAGAPVLDVLATNPATWSALHSNSVRITQADAERLSDTRTPQGDFAVIRDELPSAQDAIRALPADTAWHSLALDGVQDPGNVGAIIRSAAAFSIELILIGPGSADPTHPRVTRAATGAWFQAKIARSSDLLADLTDLHQQGARVIAADPHGTPLDTIKLKQPTVWLFGNEGSGISLELEPQVDERVAVPIAPSVESLNVAVAAGIIFHHIRRTAASLEGNPPCASPPGT